MTVYLGDTAEAAIDLVTQIQSTLATLDLMAAQALDNADIATDMDINTLARTLDKLNGTEDAWSQALQIIDGAQQLADAAGEHDTQADQIDPEIRALLDATGRCPSEDTGSMYTNPYTPAVQR